MEITRTLPITHKYGLHARASTKFAEVAQQFRAAVFLARAGASDGEVDGKSVLGILTLGIELGHEIVLRVEGDDAEAAIAALEELVRADFHGV
ncbi:MAG: HPr family phosphocarrier protein [Planctomycetota bacterium]